jgi:hypothetical protein
LPSGAEIGQPDSRQAVPYPINRSNATEAARRRSPRHARQLVGVDAAQLGQHGVDPRQLGGRVARPGSQAGGMSGASVSRTIAESGSEAARRRMRVDPL